MIAGVVFLIGFLLSGIWFGGQMLTSIILYKKKLNKIEMFRPLISGIIPAIIVCVVTKTNPLKLSGFLNIKAWIIAILTVLLVSIIIKMKKTEEREGAEDSLFGICVEAAFMEVPQRAMMQTFVFALLKYFGLNVAWGILITALIWCAGIVLQAFMKKVFDMHKLIMELLASFVFSLGIGYVFWQSQCLLIPMFCHALERYLTNVKPESEKVKKT